jgi:hypothetical protein
MTRRRAITENELRARSARACNPNTQRAVKAGVEDTAACSSWGESGYEVMVRRFVVVKRSDGPRRGIAVNIATSRW